MRLLILSGGEHVCQELAANLPTSQPVQITVISPEIHPELWKLENLFGNLHVQEKEAELADLEGMDLVIPAKESEVGWGCPFPPSCKMEKEEAGLPKRRFGVIWIPRRAGNAWHLDLYGRSP
ncbi:MAG: hypothetical protein IPN20_08410 [Haliscomenobacter sp.]|nr:hypothetical protein [Haliscomenobacter sp.]